VEAIRAEIGNIDITYVYNNEHDDFDEIDRVSLAFEYPVRNPTNLGWMLAIPRLARAQNRRVLLLGLVGNFTTGWNGWSQSCHHLLRGRLRLAYRQYRALYRNSKLSHWMAFRKLFVDPLRSDLELDLRDWYRGGTAPWQGHSPIRPEFAAEMQVDARAREAGHDFRYRSRYGERHNGMRMVDYLGDWFAAIKAMYGVEMRDPLADIDLVEYCFGIPDEQYLVEGIDRSLIRRAMWGLLPPSVLTNRQFGLQSADWYEKATAQRAQIKQQIADIASSSLVRRSIDIDRLQNAVDTWPTSGWHTRPVMSEYQLALTRGLAVGRFLRWMDAQNR
jgi:asparagine synthase (glutamine-hydrolysing)